MSSSNDMECMNIVNSKITSSVLIGNYHLIEMVYAKVYTTNKSGKAWLYSDICGNLCLLVDYNRLSARLMMLDIHNYQIVFEAELYKKFESYYTKGDDNFQYFEVNNGFIGFYIKDKAQATTFYDTIKTLSEDKIQRIIKNKKNPSLSEIKSHADIILIMIKQKIMEEYFFKNSELAEKEVKLNGRQINRSLNLIEWDKNAKIFKMKGNSQEMTQLIRSVQSVKKVENFKVQIENIRNYAKQLSMSIINSQKVNEKKVPQQPVVIPPEKKSIVIPEKPKPNVPEKVKDPPKDMKKPQPKGVVPPVPKGVVPPVPKGLPPLPVPGVAKPKTDPPKTDVPKTDVPKTTVPLIEKQSETNNTNKIQSNIANVENNNNQIVEKVNPTDEGVEIQRDETTEEKPKSELPPPKKDMFTELKERMNQRASQMIDGKLVIPNLEKKPQENKPAFTIQLKKVPGKNDVNTTTTTNVKKEVSVVNQIKQEEKTTPVATTQTSQQSTETEKTKEEENTITNESSTKVLPEVITKEENSITSSSSSSTTTTNNTTNSNPNSITAKISMMNNNNQKTVVNNEAKPQQLSEKSNIFYKLI